MNICREMRPASPSSYSHHIIDNRVQRSMAGWSVIEKITDFVHAVCRVSDGRGSAILVAIPSPRAHGGCDVMQDGQQLARRNNVGVLLTTSFVFPNREEAQRATVTFLEQPVAGTSAREGRDVEPLMVAVNADKVFLCSTARATARFPPRRGSRFVSDAGTEEATGSRPLGSSNASRTNFFDSFRYGINGGEEEEEELGYTLTLCELGPPDEYTLTPYSPNPSLASPGHSFLGSCEISTHIPGLFHILLGSPSRFANNMDQKPELHSNPTTSSFSETGNLGGRGSAYRWDSYPIKPLPLPLLLSRIAPVKVGDSHLMITHVNGNERRYIVQKVKSVGRDSCEYEFFDPSSEFSSGGPIFDIRGDFVGLQHQNGDHSYGIFISSIVQHLFQSSLLGVCRLPIVDKNTEEGKFDMNAVVPDDVFNQPFHINQGYCVLNVGAGDQLIEYEDFERLRVRSDIKGFTQPPSLVAPDSQQVWKEFYQGFHSLIRILHAFSHAPKLTKLALERITSHEHREDLPNVASLGGIGVVLEIIDGYPQNEEIVLSALTVLARTSLYKLNREVIFRCDGVLTVLEIMSEYSHQASIQQWGFYCLYNLMADDSPVKSESIDLFARCQGIALAIEVLRVHTNVRHALRHACFALSCVANEDLRYVHKMVYGGITNIIVERMKSNMEDTFVFFGLATLLHNLLSCIIPFENDQIMLMYIPGIPNVSEVAISYCDETQSSTLDVSNNRGCNDNVGSGGGGVSSILLDTLVTEKVLAVLATAMSSECVNRYSSSAVTLLEACIGSVVVLLSRRKSELQTELSSVELKRTCEQIIHNFPTEKYLQEQAERIINTTHMEKRVVLAEESGVDPSQSAAVNTGLQDATAALEMDEMHAHVRYKQRVVTLTYSRKKGRLILHRRNKKGKTVDMVNISTASIINVETPEERILRQLRSKNMNGAQGAMFAANSKPSFHGFFKMSPKDAETLYPCSMSVSISSISLGNHSRSADGAVPGGMLHSSCNASRSPEHARSLFYLHLVRDSGSSTSISTIEFSSLPGYENHHALQHIVKTVLSDIYPRGAKKLILFVSPKSGSGKALDITERDVLPVLHFSRHEVSTIVTKRAFHCEDYIAELGNDITDKDVLVCVGGDGMIHEAVNGLFRRRQALLKREAERRENEKRNSDDSHPENQKNKEEGNNGKLKEIDTRKSNVDCKKNKVRSEDIGGIGEEKRENGGSEIMHGKDKDGDASNSKGKNKDILKLMEFDKLNSTTSAGTKFSFPFIATIPTGSGCGMAKTLGITDIKKSIIALVHLKTCVKDLMKMNYILGENMKADFPLFPHSIAMDVRDTEKEKDVPRDLTEQEEEKNEKQITAERIAFMSITFGILNKIDRGSEKLRWMGNSRFTAYGAYTFLRGVRSYGVRLRYLPWIGSSGQQVEKLEGEGFIPNEKEFPRCTWTTACKHCQAHRNIGDPLAICSSSSSADKLSFSIDGLPHTHAFEAECDPVDFDDDSLPWATLDGNHYAIFVSNICNAAKDILMTPLAHMSDGAIDIVFTREKEIKQGRSGFLKFFTSMDTGSHVNLPFVSYIKVRALELEANEGFLMSDGEVMPFTKVQITPLRHVTEFVRVG